MKQHTVDIFLDRFEFPVLPAAERVVTVLVRRGRVLEAAAPHVRGVRVV